MIKVQENNGRIEVVTPYNKDFVAFAKKERAKWMGESKAWSFDKESEERLTEALKEIYGYGEEKTDVTVKVDSIRGKHFNLFGLPLLSRFYRDSPVKISEHCKVISGELPERGGSVKHPDIYADDLVLKIFGVAKSQLAKADLPEGVELMDGEKQKLDALEKEKKELLERLAEIEVELKKLKGE